MMAYYRQAHHRRKSFAVDVKICPIRLGFCVYKNSKICFGKKIIEAKLIERYCSVIFIMVSISKYLFILFKVLYLILFTLFLIVLFIYSQVRLIIYSYVGKCLYIRLIFCFMF